MADRDISVYFVIRDYSLLQKTKNNKLETISAFIIENHRPVMPFILFDT